ncbi:MAG: hypothetical protein K9J21_07270 [Bacteroidales bacterium]|nr:hypothetical protein [Bacteroidales bacterium]
MNLHIEPYYSSNNNTLFPDYMLVDDNRYIWLISSFDECMRFVYGNEWKYEFTN